MRPRAGSLGLVAAVLAAGLAVGCGDPPPSEMWTRAHVLPLPEEHARKVYSMAVSDDGSRLLCIYSGGAVRLWDIESDATVADLPRGHGGRGPAMVAGGAAIVIPTPEGAINVYATVDGDLLRVIQATPGPRTILHTSPWTPRIVTSRAPAHTLEIWNVHTGAREHEIQGTDCRPGQASLARDGSRLAVGYMCMAHRGEHSGVAVWDLATGRRDDLPGPYSLPYIAPGGRRLLTGAIVDAADRHIPPPLWDIGADGRPPLQLSSKRVPAPAGWLPDGRLLGETGDGRVAVWDPRDGRRARVFPKRSKGVRRVGHRGTRLATYRAETDAVHVWDIDTRDEVASFQAGVRRPVAKLAYSDDGSTIVVADGLAAPYHDGVQIWRRSTDATRGEATANARANSEGGLR